MSARRRFTSVAAAGVTFQAGSSAVDSATIMSTLVFQLTGSPILVGMVTAILRFGWLSPQLFIGFIAQRSRTSMRYYIIGGFGRALCMGALAVTLFVGQQWTYGQLAVAVMLLWTAYSFISGIVAVPYNDIVARAVPSELRSRLLATRFFGGGVLALGVVAIANWLVSSVEFPISYSAVIGMAAVLMFISAGVFVSMGEPGARTKQTDSVTFMQYLSEGIDVFRTDRRFRLFVYAQWCGGAVLMAMPFYVIQATNSGIGFDNVALLLGAQTVGALVSNALWGWWGDRRGKRSLLQVIVFGRILPPTSVLLLTGTQLLDQSQALFVFLLIFLILGALANGLTIAVIGFLMEISPDDLRPSYSGYFNAITAPAFLLPLIAGIIAAAFGLHVVFAISLIAAVCQYAIIYRLQSDNPDETKAAGNAR